MVPWVEFRALVEPLYARAGRGRQPVGLAIMAGYQGQGAAIRKAAPHTQDMTCRRTKFKGGVDEKQRKKNRTQSRVRALVEHPFRIFGFDKARYRGLAKNYNRLCACFALVNLYRHRVRLAGLGLAGLRPENAI